MSINLLKDLRNIDTYEEDDDWTFGQIISVALFSSSLLPIFELAFKTFFDAKHPSLQKYYFTN
ncbi:uncharacterized protein GLRG_08047 [Colletotrichum graminicola M1.001]|uniref:Uncharacterized protein n=1 Tax=Colletotrichum graminicola (strain M1.001 / M2 / FGSC 10212) TaxID=645133 RepID=E3QPJ8_COLGM|nr:uncharacterized protein GLRG_08047 [Colletotrichum graminicola M1.001]EFQ32903.1 hypothetical protein GLRG_08047 [Colletotrichum graminicola M1.001]